MKQWEYHVVKGMFFSGPCDFWIAELGREGWELVTVINDRNNTHDFVFKRQKESM